MENAFVLVTRAVGKPHCLHAVGGLLLSTRCATAGTCLRTRTCSSGLRLSGRGKSRHDLGQLARFHPACADGIHEQALVEVRVPGRRRSDVGARHLTPGAAQKKAAGEIRAPSCAVGEET